MNFMKKLVLSIFVLMLSLPTFAKNIAGDWHNDLRDLFLQNNAIIYTINMRTFNAKDTNGDELIDETEESGNFMNAIERLDNLSDMGINTLHILPITPVGKIKAYGTAGSLYAITNFSEINPQLVSKSSSLPAKSQAKKFIKECHKRNIRVIIDLPSCGAYDMFLEHPEYFVKDKEGNPIVPLDWSDVRLFDTNKKNSLNNDLVKEHKKFVDMAISIGADGIRADVARLKSQKFWKEIIDYARKKDSEFLFLAEASPSWTDAVSPYAYNATVEELFNAGFDGYLGNYFNLKNMKTGKELITTVENDLKLFKKYDNQKSVIGSFTTHDEVSPVLIHGADFSKMIIWLNSTLPLNSYYVDGFQTGDTYTYPLANKYAKKSQTDDEYYFTHNGQIDIFNFSRKPDGKDLSIQEEFILANKFKAYYESGLSTAKFVPLKVSNPKVFAYARVMNNASVVVFGNLDFKDKQAVVVKVPKLKHKNKIVNIRVVKNIHNEYSKGKIKTTLAPGDIQVLLIRNLVF